MTQQFILPDKTVWFSPAWQPALYGFCPSERAWKVSMRNMGQPNSDYPVKSSDAGSIRSAGSTTIFTCDEGSDKGRLCLLVTLGSRHDRYWQKNPERIAAIIAHESQHVWMEMLRNIGERGRGIDELEAYAVQSIFQEILVAYLNTRVRRKRTANRQAR